MPLLLFYCRSPPQDDPHTEGVHRWTRPHLHVEGPVCFRGDHPPSVKSMHLQVTLCGWHRRLCGFIQWQSWPLRLSSVLLAPQVCVVLAGVSRAGQVLRVCASGFSGAGELPQQRALELGRMAVGEGPGDGELILQCVCEVELTSSCDWFPGDWEHRGQKTGWVFGLQNCSLAHRWACTVSSDRRVLVW